MLNVLIPMSGASVFFENSGYVYPKPLIEVRGVPMIQWVIENISAAEQDLNFIFIVNDSDCKEFHIDQVLRLLTEDRAEVITVKSKTGGIACSALLAIDSINNDDPLVVLNADQIFDIDLHTVFNHFSESECDAGVACFDSVHPRWSYALTDDSGYVVQTSEKRPISKNAIAGLFWFNKGKDFVAATMESIYKDANVNGQYYIAPVLNEMVLDGKKIGMKKIKNEDFHSFYSPQLLEEYNRVAHD